MTTLVRCAFANICRHRGTSLACGAPTVRGVVQCPYHAWSYELDGELRLAPHFGDVPNFEPAAMGLQRCRTPSGVDGSSSTSMAGPARSRTTSVPSVR